MNNSINTAVHTVMMLICLACASMVHAQNSFNDYNVLPASLLSGEETKPNVLLIFDNSGSMHLRLDTPTNGFACIAAGEAYPNCSYNAASRSASGRAAMQDVFESLRGRLNMGLMVYDAAVGGGDLLAPVQLFDNVVDPVTGSVTSANYNVMRTRINTINNVGAIGNSGGTPIEGTLLHALDYFQGSAGGFPTAQNQTGLPNADIFISPQQCTDNNFVILVTDGEPTVNPQGTYATACTDTDRVVCSAEAASDLFAEGITTFVIGFGPSADGVDQIAAAGDGTAGSGDETRAFAASNGEALVAAFDDIFGTIFERTSSSSRGSVLGSNASGAGVQIYPSFVPRTTDSVGNVVNWTGSLQSFFVDQNGFLRQNSSGSKTDPSLDENGDGIFEFANDADDVLSYLDFGTERTENETGVIKPLTDPADNSNNLIPVWDAAEQLATVHPALVMSSPNGYRSSVRENRDYEELPNNGGGARYIFTCIDTDTVNNSAATTCDESESRPFVWDNSNSNSQAITPSLRHYLLAVDDASLTDAQNAAVAENLLYFIRGDESLNSDNSYLSLNDTNYVEPDFRKRTLNRNTGDERRYLLGDLVNSNALQVGVRNSYTDSSYDAYRELSVKKRNVVYVGANDGMLHAFNAGFFDPANSGYSRQNGSQKAFDLGEELWAYIPQSVLPHLRFLSNPGYNSGQHVYYVDGQVSAFDAKIFSGQPAATYPNGWGTILVATTRLGGFDHDIDTSGDGVLDSSDKRLRSSVVILDITDPEKAPRLLAEISHPNLGVTSSAPTLVREGANDWHLVFGSGPTNVKEFTSNQTARIFKYKLTDTVSNWDFVSSAPYSNQGTQLASASANSFVGNMASRDWNGDNYDDAVYFGTVSGFASAPGGDMRRIKLGGTGTDALSIMVDTGEPTPLAPFLIVDEQRNSWVISHSGRFFSGADWNYQSPTWMYAVREKFQLISRGVLELADSNFTDAASNTIEVADNLSATASELVNVTGVEITAGGDVNDPLSSLPSPSPSTFDELAAFIQQSNDIVGWRKRLIEPTATPNERFLQSPVAIPGIDAMIFSTYIPPEGACAILPSGVTYGLSFVTGTAFYDPYIVIAGDVDSGLLGLTAQDIVNEKEIESTYKSITRAQPRAKEGEDPTEPCENVFSFGRKGIDGTTDTRGLTTRCTDPSRKSWVEIDLSRY